MKNVMTYILVALLSIFITGVLNVNAQDSEDDQAYWYVSEFKITDNEKLDSLRSIEQKYGPKVWKEYKKMGGILDYKLLIHDTGGEYNVVRMTLYPDWDSIRNGPPMDKAVKKAIPDSAKREKIRKAMQWIFEGAPHKDNIYTEALSIE